jgi:RNA polymerase subunit RPABC4/transcription elongation factor Spt4
MVKMCTNCTRLYNFDEESCPGCGCEEFRPVILDPEGMEADNKSKLE